MSDTSGRQSAYVDTTISPAGGLEPDRLKPEVKRADGICDSLFLEELKSLKDLRSFLIKEAVDLATSEDNLHALGNLSTLKYEPKGRHATPEEWVSLERLTQELFGHLTDPLRRKYTSGNIPKWVSALSLFLAVTALVSLLLSIFLGTQTKYIFFQSPRTEAVEFATQNILLFYALWLFSLGSLGAIAFIAMNALAIQQDITFDLANSRLEILRIVLGGLFGFVLTLPFGFQSYVFFCKNISLGHFPLFDDEMQVPLQALMLILPFGLGFSAPLVIMILNQFIEAAQAFFGKRSSPTVVIGAPSDRMSSPPVTGAPSDRMSSPPVTGAPSDRMSSPPLVPRAGHKNRADSQSQSGEGARDRISDRAAGAR
jgi:hypothetical protein